MDSQLLHAFSLNGVWIAPLEGAVSREGVVSHLAPAAMEVLLHLTSEPDRMVTRETLRARVWGDAADGEQLLDNAIEEIRTALGDDPDRPTFIETVAQQGFRLIAWPAPASSPGGAGVPEHRASARLDEPGLFASLKRRGVLETAIAYFVLGWLIIQVADVVFDQLHLPDWAGTFVTALVIAGFPIALALSWFLEFRDGRAVLDTRAAGNARRRRISRTYMSVLGAMTLAAAGVFVYDRNVGLPQAPTQAAPASPAPAAEIALPPVQDNAIAVLPFLNLDGSTETEIFAHGLVDDVITRLSRVPGLLVSSRGDAYTLEPNSASSRVRERLRVARYLEGSVQMDGDRMRIIVQLIDSETGFHVLSRKFDRPREDFFAIRDEITELTVANVRVALPPETRSAAVPAGDDPSLDVYMLYRRGIDASRQSGSSQSIESALAWFDQALAVDPDYAAAHAGKCSVYVAGYPVTDDPAYIDHAEASCARALELNPNLDVVHEALGELYAATGRYDDAEAAYLKTLDIDPNSVAALTGVGEIYLLQQKPDLAEQRFRQAIGLHPGDWSAYNALGYFLYRSGRYAEAAEQYEVVVALDNRNVAGFRNLGAAYMMAADFASAAPAFRKANEIEPNALAYSNLGLMYYYLGRPEEAIAAHRRAVALAPKDHLTWSNLGDALWIDGRREEAQETFHIARELAWGAQQVNPNNPGYLMDLAWITAMLDQAAEARRLIDRALGLAPDDPYAHYYDGLIRLRVAETTKALSAFEAALERGYPENMLVSDPQLQALHDDSRFRQMIDRGKPD